VFVHGQAYTVCNLLILNWIPAFAGMTDGCDFIPPGVPACAGMTISKNNQAGSIALK
jgi:hypothetical protein